ncbi:universal stress protein [Glycomyces harbinensis]|uniref:Nucleotide-binding universal stress protein, UspA family n=1 Tax=Glycomyces harbinensis TaxID=58114 RepID=A0A1G6SGX5_9ACTN|nr:universal stress protein [Glycomyces harbinensis]SDD16162.1 Nucleotide-binding universal stress protein, UspA family [Glycomyces harbinensis]
MAQEERERVLVGVDGSEASIRALRWAMRYAERTGAVIEAVHVWQVPTTYGSPVKAVPGENFAETGERALNETVDHELAGRKDLEVRRIAQGGHPSDVMVERSRSADLLVVGSRGQGGLKGALLGSVSLRCVTHAACPVVVIRAED